MAQALKYTVFKIEWGYFGFAAVEKGLILAHLPINDKTRLTQELLVDFPGARLDKNLFKKVQQQIVAYFEGQHIDFDPDLPLIYQGCSDFKISILTACRKVRFGQTISYSRLAEKAGFPRAARAVGGVMGDNPVPLIIPCHRVLTCQGQIGGFTAEGGTKLKKKMLELEK